MSDYDNLISLWGIQDSLLQSYRRIYLTSQSILFAIAVFAVNKQIPVLKDLFPILGVIMVAFWIFSTRERASKVDYFQKKIRKMEETRKEQDRILNKFKEEFPDRKIVSTRSMLNYYLPIIFIILWMLLIVYNSSLRS